MGPSEDAIVYLQTLMCEFTNIQVYTHCIREVLLPYLFFSFNIGNESPLCLLYEMFLRFRCLFPFYWC